jgi:hypothetical protein
VSTSWSKPPPPRCTARSCARASRIAYVSLVAAYVTFACLLLTPYRIMFAALVILSLTTTLAAAGYICPHLGDDGIEALMEATREDRPAAGVVDLGERRREAGR